MQMLGECRQFNRPPRGYIRIAILVVRCDKGAIDYAATLVEQHTSSIERDRKRATSAASMLLSIAPERIWGSIDRLMREDAPCVRDLFIDASSNDRIAAGLCRALDERRLADLYIWLAQQFPPENDPKLGGHRMDARDHMPFFRNGLLDTIVKRGTAEACEQIERIRHAFPQHDWLAVTLARAKVVMHENSWIPLTPSQISVMEHCPSPDAAAQLEQYRFDVAVSFAGEYRDYVKQVVDTLLTVLPRDRVLYDQHFRAELARSNSDTLLQGFYLEAELLVVFLCPEYEQKEWCGLEWRVVRDLIKRQQNHRIMLPRFDAVEIAGLFSIDGYIDLREQPAEQAATWILERLDSNRRTATQESPGSGT